MKLSPNTYSESPFPQPVMDEGLVGNSENAAAADHAHPFLPVGREAFFQTITDQTFATATLTSVNWPLAVENPYLVLSGNYLDLSKFPKFKFATQHRFLLQGLVNFTNVGTITAYAVTIEFYNASNVLTSSTVVWCGPPASGLPTVQSFVLPFYIDKLLNTTRRLRVMVSASGSGTATLDSALVNLQHEWWR